MGFIGQLMTYVTAGFGMFSFSVSRGPSTIARWSAAVKFMECRGRLSLNGVVSPGVWKSSYYRMS